MNFSRGFLTLLTCASGRGNKWISVSGYVGNPGPTLRIWKGYLWKKQCLHFLERSVMLLICLNGTMSILIGKMEQKTPTLWDGPTKLQLTAASLFFLFLPYLVVTVAVGNSIALPEGPRGAIHIALTSGSSCFREIFQAFSCFSTTRKCV